MKPGGRLQRRSPWTPTAGQVQRRRDTRQEAAQRYAAKPRTQPSRAGESRARRLVRARSGGLCEIAIPGVCTRLATDWCHRLNRSQGGRWLASHGLHGCRPCHRATTNTQGHRDEYETNGWVLRRHLDPATTPVLVRGRRVLLDDQGGWTPAPTTNDPTGEAV